MRLGGNVRLFRWIGSINGAIVDVSWQPAAVCTEGPTPLELAYFVAQPPSPCKPSLAWHFGRSAVKHSASLPRLERR